MKSLPQIHPNDLHHVLEKRSISAPRRALDWAIQDLSIKVNVPVLKFRCSSSRAIYWHKHLGMRAADTHYRHS